MTAVLAITTAGCTTVGPNFKPPAAPTTQRYTPPAEATAPAADAESAAPRQTIALGEKVTGDWWTLFRSPDLDGLVKQAIAGSPTLGKLAKASGWPRRGRT